jgi:hypothetical protein
MDRAAKLPTPVLTGSGSKGLSQPTDAGTPASRRLIFKHESPDTGEYAA